MFGHGPAPKDRPRDFGQPQELLLLTVDTFADGVEMLKGTCVYSKGLSNGHLAENSGSRPDHNSTLNIFLVVNKPQFALLTEAFQPAGSIVDTDQVTSLP